MQGYSLKVQGFLAGRTGMKATAIAALLIGASSAGHAQTYVGDAYGVDTSVANVLGARVCDAALQTSGSATPITSNLANADVIVVNVGLASGDATTGVINSSTVGSGGFIDSKNVVNDLALPIATLETLHATTITSETTASFSSASAAGSSIISNLYYTDAAGNHFALNADGSVNQVIAGIPGVVSVTLNEQTWNAAHDALTTNAIDVQTVLGSHVIVSSSTAGFTGVGMASAPEPGSVALLSSLVLPGLVGAVRLRRRSIAQA